jgi:hypothetical protein
MAAGSSETSLRLYWSARRHIPWGSCLFSDRSESRMAVKCRRSWLYLVFNYAVSCQDYIAPVPGGAWHTFSEKTLSDCHFVHRKSDVDHSGTETGPSDVDAGWAAWGLSFPPSPRARRSDAVDPPSDHRTCVCDCHSDVKASSYAFTFSFFLLAAFKLRNATG